MKSFPQRFIFLSLASLLCLLLLSSCAERSFTRINIKKTNDALLETRKEASVKIPPEPKVQLSSENGPVPMSSFMSETPKNTIPFANKWFPRLQAWAKIYRDIATQEQNVRNYSLSSKYSAYALSWANRSLEIKDLPNEKAIIKIQLWIGQIKIPNLPEEPIYFSGKEVYKKISDTKKLVESLQQRFCLIFQGVQIVPSLAYLELSTDLLGQKKYTKASSKIENASGPLQNIEEEVNKCKNPETAIDLKN